MTPRAACLALLLFVPVGAAVAQRGGRGFGRTQAALGDPNEFYTPPDFRGNAKYDGRFTFARIKYRGFEHFQSEGPGWSHDYPRAESHFMRIMREITTLRPFVETDRIIGGNILALDDPELFKYPVAYLSEPGGWHPTESEVLGLRNYLLKGGFLILDDFSSYDWPNFELQMKGVLPKMRLMDVPDTHPIFDSFFKVNRELISGRGRGETPTYHGIFQDNDPKKRLMVIANLNNDIGEYWQWSDRGFNVAPSNEAYKLGVNYIIYALTH